MSNTPNSCAAVPLVSPASFRARLLSWYDANARDLPWREDHDPYRVWVSEIMLQQTRVAAVIAHYHEFLRRFPTVGKLAAAREASVLAAWSGLGYYRRARMMHAAAKLIVRRDGANFPRTAGGWIELPGIGRYTAAAVASIAFGERAAVVDGNVERLLQRVAGNRLTRGQLWQSANVLLDPNRPGDFNQAMMELGAVVCTPRAPACASCPILDMCPTRGEARERTQRPPQQKREVHFALICRGESVFLVRRKNNASLMAGMWELPGAGKPLREKAPATGPLFRLKHSITITNYSVSVWPQLRPLRLKGEWVGARRLPKTALTGLARKILVRAGFFAKVTATPANRTLAQDKISCESGRMRRHGASAAKREPTHGSASASPSDQFL